MKSVKVKFVLKIHSVKKKRTVRPVQSYLTIAMKYDTKLRQSEIPDEIKILILTLPFSDDASQHG